MNRLSIIQQILWGLRVASGRRYRFDIRDAIEVYDDLSDFMDSNELYVMAYNVNGRGK